MNDLVLHNNSESAPRQYVNSATRPANSSSHHLRAALAYARRGWDVFPVWWIREDGRCACGRPDCPHPGKHPIGALAPHGWKSATTNEAIIRRWWTRYPRANIAWALPGDVVVVDEDPRNGGDVLNLPLTWADRQTLTAATGGGGRHLIYRLPPADPGQRWVNRSLGDGLDVKTHGGYIILAPSNHATGGVYAWADGLGPNEAVILPAPPALLSILPVETRPAANLRPSPAATTPVSANLRERMVWVLSELCPDFHPDQARGKLLCPFHHDTTPSFDYDLNKGVFYCHGNGCIAHKRGNKVTELERLARVVHGLVYRKPDQNETIAAAPFGEGSVAPTDSSPAAALLSSSHATGTTGAVAIKTASPVATGAAPLPWAITAEDWHECPVCSAWNHSTRATAGGLALRVHHIICKRRDCPVSEKARAGDLLAGIEEWPAIFTATIAAEDWPRVRVRARRAGARHLGIPTPGGVVAICDQADILPGEATAADLATVYEVFRERSGRIRRPQTRTRAALDRGEVLAELAPGGAVTKFAAPNLDTTREALEENAAAFGERLDVLRAGNTHEPPPELVALARQLTARGLPPEMLGRVRGAWEKVGIVPEGNRAFATIEQGRALLVELAALKRDITRDGLREIRLYGDRVGHIGTNRASSPAGAPVGRGEARRKRLEDPANGERGRQLCLKTYC